MANTTFSGPIRAGNIKNTTDGLKTITTQGGGTGEWANSGTADLKLTVKNTAATTAGVAVIKIMYAQAYNTVIRP